MIEVLKKEYWSKAEAFLVPLTGIDRQTNFEMNAYLFWRDHSIEDYKLMVSFDYKDYEEFLRYCRVDLFPALDEHGYLLESYDLKDRSVFVLDMAEWAMDIEQFKAGKYSKFSKVMKDMIINYHTNKKKIEIYLYAALYPNERMKLLMDHNKELTPIEYVSKFWGFDYDDLVKIGEVGSVYDKKAETLITEIDDFCQIDRFRL